MVVTAPDSLPCIGMHYQTHTFPLANLTQVVIIIYRCISISLCYSYCRTGFRICQPINDRVHLLHKNEDLIKGTRLSLTRGRCQHAARTRSNIPECQDGMSLSKSGRQRWFIVLHPFLSCQNFPIFTQAVLHWIIVTRYRGNPLLWAWRVVFFCFGMGSIGYWKKKFRTGSEKIL